MEYVHCNLCGTNDTELLHRVSVSDKTLKFYRHSRNSVGIGELVGDFFIVKCKNCGLVYTNPRLSSEQLEIMYSSNTILGGNWKNFPYLFNSNFPDELQDLKQNSIKYDTLEKWKVRLFKDYMYSKKNLRLLDVGCGAGKFVRQCIDSGIDAYGLDLSQDRIEYGIKEYELKGRIWKGTLDEESNKGNTYDIITLWDVIEHVPDPSLLLSEVKRITHANSRVFLLTMSLDSFTYKLYKKSWYYIHPPQHLHYFSHETMRKMLQKNGFSLVGCEMDHTRNKNFIHLWYRMIMGLLNHALFIVWRKPIPIVKYLLYPLWFRFSNERMLKRFENIQPSLCAGRYKDNFVFIAEPKS
jgi:2-polyprenyl-3-methyl-5-hydroxy-6-metoxy-1,4-benzoquinol methylase